MDSVETEDSASERAPGVAPVTDCASADDSDGDSEGFEFPERDRDEVSSVKACGGAGRPQPASSPDEDECVPGAQCLRMHRRHWQYRYQLYLAAVTC
jgi:hypothetical protein